MSNTDETAAMVQTLYDRMLIEDLFVRYYSGLGGGDPEGFGKFFVEGAELDVNGIVVHGREAIGELYRQVGLDKPRLTGKFRMLLTNGQIEVNGDTAKAQFLWTQTLNDTLKGPPRLIEQGREFDDLIKRDGAWRITRRVVIADSALPDMMDESYKPVPESNLPMGR